MYEVRLNDAVIHEPDVNSVRRLSAGVLTDEINQIPDFSFTIPAMNPAFSQELNDRTDIITLTNTLTGEVEFEGPLLTHKDSMDSSGHLSKKASAEGFLGYLCDSIQMYRNYPDSLPAEFLAALLDDHNRQVTDDGHPEKQIQLGLCDITKGDYTRSKTTAYRNTFEEIKINLIDRIGGEIQVRRVNGQLVLDYLERIGVRCSTSVELAKNMKSLEVDTDSMSIITRLVPLGCQIDPGDSAERLTIESVNGGKPYIDDEAAIEKYGIIAGTAEFDDITLPENLIRAGREYLADNNRVRKAYEAQVLDLSVLDKSQQSLRCGNTYPFKNEFMGIDEELRLMKRSIDIYKPYSPMVQIGDKAQTITDIAVRTARLIEYDMPKQKLDILASAKATATALIKAGTNGYVVVNENEICIMDTPDKETATKVWRWNSGGFGYSSTGYDGEYGTAVTMDGAIVADFITAGVLRGMEILNGKGTFHVHPDGTVEASAINITGGAINISTDSETQDIISLSFANNRCILSPTNLTFISSHNNNAVIVHGTGIDFYPDRSDGSSRSVSISSENGSFTSSGAVSGAELKFQRNGSSVSVREEFDSVWSEIQTIWNAINHYHGGGGS